MLSDKYAKINPLELSKAELSDRIFETEGAIQKIEAETLKYNKAESLAKKLMFGSVLAAIIASTTIGTYEVFRKRNAPEAIREFYTQGYECKELQESISKLEKMPNYIYFPSRGISSNVLEKILGVQKENERVRKEGILILKEQLNEINCVQKYTYETNPEVKSYVNKTNKIGNMPSPPWNSLPLLAIIGAGAIAIRNMRKGIAADNEKDMLEFHLGVFNKVLEGKTETGVTLKDNNF